jgi:hypothetical protein
VRATLRSAARSVHRGHVFRRAMRRFLDDPGACADPASAALGELIYGWGNESWSASGHYLAGCIRHALDTRGPTLECGSGLSTILLGAIARQRGERHWALEHAPEWAARVQACLHRYGLDCVAMCANPLKDYGPYSWYDAPLDSMPESFALVICDGPPGSTPGGRYGLAPVMNTRLEPGCVILLDDAGREPERAIAQRWAHELCATQETLGEARPYIRMTVGARP